MVWWSTQWLGWQAQRIKILAMGVAGHLWHLSLLIWSFAGECMGKNEGSQSPGWGDSSGGSWMRNAVLGKRETPVALDTKRQKFTPVQVCSNRIQGLPFPLQPLCRSRYCLFLPLTLDTKPTGGTFLAVAAGSPSHPCLPPQKHIRGPRPDPDQCFFSGQIAPGCSGPCPPRHC